MDLVGKLQLKPGQTVFIGKEPAGVVLDLPDAVANPADADAVLVFAEAGDDLKRWRRELAAAVDREALTWLAYPKGGALGTDLNRDVIGERLQADRLRAVRQIAIDDVWSALRLRRI